MDKFYYHATPYDFSILNAGSWLAETPVEAGIHLIMKNAQDGRDIYEGKVLYIPKYLCKGILEEHSIGSGGSHFTTSTDISLNTVVEMSLREVLKGTPFENIKEITPIDLSNQ